MLVSSKVGWIFLYGLKYPFFANRCLAISDLSKFRESFVSKNLAKFKNFRCVSLLDVWSVFDKVNFSLEAQPAMKHGTSVDE